MKARILFWLKICVSAALFGFLLTLIDLDDLFRQLLSLDVRYLMLAFVLLLTQFVLSSRKWQLILRSDGVLIGLPFLIKTYMIGGFISLFLPTSFGGDVYRVVAVRGVNRDLAKSTSSVLFDRLSGLFALVSICIVGYLVLPEQSYEAVVFVLYVLGVVGFLILSSDTAIDFVDASKIKIVKKGVTILRSFQNYRKYPRLIAWILLLAFAFQFIVVVNVKFYTLALGIEISFFVLLVIVPLIFLTEALPISINGLGVRESAFAFFFAMNGLTVGEGVAVALLIVAERYLLGLIGGALLLARVISSRMAVAKTSGNPARGGLSSADDAGPGSPDPAPCHAIAEGGSAGVPGRPATEQSAMIGRAARGATKP
jgi:glycosyltransferase 2 family protein